MKTFLKIVAGLIVVIALGIGAVFYFTSGMVEVVDTFFTAVRRGDDGAARLHLSEAFRSSTDEASLNRFLRESGLADVTATSWSRRSIESGTGTLEGTVTTDTGGTVPLRMQLVKEGGTWKILSLRKTAAGLIDTQGAAAPAIPGREEALGLARQAMHDLGVSLAGDSMEHFRSTVSAMWREQYSVAKLEEAYGRLRKANVPWLRLDGLPMVITSDPATDADGVLELQGYYDTRPQRLHFRQDWVGEAGSWKLLGLHLSFRDAPTPAPDR